MGGRAVKIYQLKMGLPVTGIIDQDDWNTVGKYTRGADMYLWLEEMGLMDFSLKDKKKAIQEKLELLLRRKINRRKAQSETGVPNNEH